MSYHMKREYLNSCAPKYVLFTVDGSTDSHPTVRIMRPNWRVSSMDMDAWESPSALSLSLACR